MNSYTSPPLAGEIMGERSEFYLDLQNSILNF